MRGIPLSELIISAYRHTGMLPLYCDVIMVPIPPAAQCGLQVAVKQGEPFLLVYVPWSPVSQDHELDGLQFQIGECLRV